MGLKLNEEAQQLADRILNENYTFTTIVTAQNYPFVTPDFWAYLWANGTYRLRDTISSYATYPDDIEITEEDYTLVLKRDLESKTLFDKCFHYAKETPRFKGIEPLVLLQNHLPEETIIATIEEEAKENQYHIFLNATLRSPQLGYYSEKLLSILFDLNKKGTSESLLEIPIASLAIVKQCLTPGLTFEPVNTFVTKSDINLLDDELPGMLLNAAINSKSFYLVDLEEILKEKKWFEVARKYWATQDIDLDYIPWQMMAKATWESFKGEKK